MLGWETARRGDHRETEYLSQPHGDVQAVARSKSHTLQGTQSTKPAANKIFPLETHSCSVCWLIDGPESPTETLK
jgi:hypothetical protein